MLYRNNGKGFDGQPLAAPGLAPGAASVRFPGHCIAVVVEEGATVNLPDDLPPLAVKSACPSLVPVETNAAPIEAPADPAPADKRKRAAKE